MECKTKSEKILMLVSDYNDFVKETSQFSERSIDDQLTISLYGLVSEIGSLVSAVKKNLIGESGSDWNKANDEIVEEVGDAIWYCFSLGQILNPKGQVNIFIHDIAQLKKELNLKNKFGEKFRSLLDTSKTEEFLKRAENFPATKSMKLSDYQELAFLTARTSDKVLIEVCIAVLWQLGAELLRRTLPEKEREINTNLADRKPNRILGEIAWHLAAVASVYGLSLDEIAENNTKKVKYRADRSDVTPLHDEGREDNEKFPRIFEISIVSLGPARSRMYFNGKRLGDDLTDNAYDDDGYRFHDVMHLAILAHLGWSPILRKMMGLKRKTESKIDEVEDGARAGIVEELVAKAFHSEGAKLAGESKKSSKSGPIRHFPNRNMITFKLLKSLHEYVKGLEVEKNKYWEWENVIYDASYLFHNFRIEKQGTVKVNLEKRSLEYSPDVWVDLSGAVVCMGSSVVLQEKLDIEKCTMLSKAEKEHLNDTNNARLLDKTIAAKNSILNALQLDEMDNSFEMLEIKLLESNRVCFKASGEALNRIWEKRIITFRLTYSQIGQNLVSTSIGLADFSDTA